MTSTQKVFFITQDSEHWQNIIDTLEVDFEWVHDLESALLNVQSSSTSGILLSDTVEDDSMIQTIVSEIKRRLPLVPLTIATERTDVSYTQSLLSCGADYVINTEQMESSLPQQIHIMQRQFETNKKLSKTNKELVIISRISSYIHSLENPSILVNETIRLLISNLNLYGVAVIITSDQHHIHMGNQTILEKNKDPQKISIPRGTDDTLQTFIKTENISIIRDWQRHKPESLQSTFDDAQSAIIIPIQHSDITFGTIILLQKETAFSASDVARYELLTTHFASAYFNISNYHTQNLHTQSVQQTLRAWQQLTHLYKLNDISDTLFDLVSQVPGIHDLVIWFFDPRHDLVVTASRESFIDVLYSWHREGYLQDLINRFDAGVHPLNQWMFQGQQSVMTPFFKELQSQNLFISQIASSMLLGGVLIGTDNPNFATQNAHLVSSLTHAAAQTIERNIFIGAKEEQTSRLEGILHSIQEGIFFVNQEGIVTYCNPQFTELTGIQPSQVYNEHNTHLLTLLADKSSQSSHVDLYNSNLQEAVRLLETDTGQYPIVELEIIQGGQSQKLVIELMQITNAEDEHYGWGGFLREPEPKGAYFDATPTLYPILEDLGVRQSQLLQSLAALRNVHKEIGNRQRDNIIKSIEDEANQLETQWRNLNYYMQLQSNEFTLEKETVTIRDIIRELTRLSYPGKHYPLNMDVHDEGNDLKIQADEMYLSRAILNIIDHAMTLTNHNAKVRISVAENGKLVDMIINIQGVTVTSTDFASLLGITNEDPEDDIRHLNLDISRQLIHLHNGNVVWENKGESHAALHIRLPRETHTENAEEIVAEESPSSIALDKMLSMQIMIIEGRNRLLSQVYDQLHETFDLVVESDYKAAIKSLSLTKFDLIIVETGLLNIDIVDLCCQIRSKSEIPMLVLADPEYKEQGVQVLDCGADDFVVTPISDKELQARIKTIAKRRFITTRTKPPLEVGNLKIDFAMRSVFLNGKSVKLTTKEYEVLQVLAMNKGQILTHQQLLSKVWGPEYRDATQYLWVNISRLRKKLEKGDKSQRFIHTESGTGYVFREN